MTKDDLERLAVRPGQWAVVAEGRWRGWELGERYEAIQIERLTAKKVFGRGKAHSRESHDRHLVTPCQDEHSARLLVDRLTSARAEMSQRVKAAAVAFSKDAERLLADAALRSRSQEEG